MVQTPASRTRRRGPFICALIHRRPGSFSVFQRCVGGRCAIILPARARLRLAAMQVRAQGLSQPFFPTVRI
tara:strand:- start:375 stop:587 length:213 start_codon:yes stop_codon:yes gene_type:complete